MGLSQRRKGKRGEREMVRLARAAGLPAERTWETAQKGGAGGSAVDVLVAGMKGQVKLGGQVPRRLYAWLAGCEALFLRRDRGRWLAVLPADRLFGLLRQEVKRTIVAAMLLVSISCGGGAYSPLRPPTPFAPPRSDFMVVVWPDTQALVEFGRAEIFEGMAHWACDHRAENNIKAVIGLGDIANRPTDAQFQVAARAYSILDACGIPNAPTVGNHDYELPHSDIGGNGRPLTTYNRYFPPSRISSRSWFVEHFEESLANHAIRISIDGRAPEAHPPRAEKPLTQAQLDKYGGCCGEHRPYAVKRLAREVYHWRALVERLVNRYEGKVLDQYEMKMLAEARRRIKESK